MPVTLLDVAINDESSAFGDPILDEDGVAPIRQESYSAIQDNDAGGFAEGFDILDEQNSEPILSEQRQFENFRLDILDGLVSAQNEAASWNAEKLLIDESVIVRTSDTVVTITLPALSGYVITADETITDTVPGVSLTQRINLIATPTILISNAPISKVPYQPQYGFAPMVAQ